MRAAAHEVRRATGRDGWRAVEAEFRARHEGRGAALLGHAFEGDDPREAGSDASAETPTAQLDAKAVAVPDGTTEPVTQTAEPLPLA